MKVLARVSVFVNKGSAFEKETFTKGKPYEYYAESSTWQNKLVERNEGTGQPSCFNEEDFVKYFKIA